MSIPGYCGGDAACSEWRIRPKGLISFKVLWTGGIQFAPNSVVSGKECDLMIPTLPENAEGGAKSMPPCTPECVTPSVRHSVSGQIQESGSNPMPRMSLQGDKHPVRADPLTFASVKHNPEGGDQSPEHIRPDIQPPHGFGGGGAAAGDLQPPHHHTGFGQGEHKHHTRNQRP